MPPPESGRTVAILIHYKHPKQTSTCLESLLRQDQPCAHILIIDNSPYDHNLASYLPDSPHIHVLQPDHNLGFGAAINLGLRHTCVQTAAFILLLNTDASLRPTGLGQLESSMNQHPDAAMVAPKIVLAENPGLLWYGGGQLDWFLGGATAPGWLGPADAKLACTPRQVDFASGCAVLIRTTAMQQLQGFDERLFMYVEDVELCMRAQRQHMSIYYEPLAIVDHIGQGTQKAAEEPFSGLLEAHNPRLTYYAFYIIRNRLLSMRRNSHGLLWWRFYRIGFPLFCGKNALSFLLHGRFAAIIAMYRGWRAYRRMQTP